MWFLTCLFLPLTQWSISLIKLFLGNCTGNCMLCHQMTSRLWTFIWKMLFALLTDAGLSRTRWATCDFCSAVVASSRQPDQLSLKRAPHCVPLPQGFLQSPGSPSGALGASRLRYRPLTKGGQEQEGTCLQVTEDICLEFREGRIVEIRLERNAGSRSTWVLLSHVKDFGLF